MCIVVLVVGEDLQGLSFEARDPTGLGLGLEQLQQLDVVH